MDKMREEFDAWFKAEKASLVDVKYQFLTKEIMFEGWQASRAALCVELPEKMNPEVLSLWDIGFNEGIESAIECIKEAGVNCK